MAHFSIIPAHVFLETEMADEDENETPPPRMALSSPLRKVFSLDCVRRRPITRSMMAGNAQGAATPTTPNSGDRIGSDPSSPLWTGSETQVTPSSLSSPCSDAPSSRASRFSSAAQRRKLVRPRPKSIAELSDALFSPVVPRNTPRRPILSRRRLGGYGGAEEVFAGHHRDLHGSGSGNDDVSTKSFLSSLSSMVLCGVKRSNALVLILLFLGTVAKSPGGGGRPGLGSAMIGSVTTALSPILPFAGGVDLRRGEHWGLEGVDDVTNYSSWAPPPSSTSVSQGVDKDTVRGTSSSSSKRASQNRVRSVLQDPVFAATEPFVPYDTIAEMTLGDIALVFSHATSSLGLGENEAGSVFGGTALSGRMATILAAMDKAVARSRGDNLLPARRGLDDEGTIFRYGNIDALDFCAAMRLLGEWRVLRQVPEGYKGYAVGMSLGRQDIVQNIAKIEAAIHDLTELRRAEYDESQMGLNGGAIVDPLRSPSLRELLQYEIDEDVQNVDKLPRLKEKSAGMGLLWVRRQLQYQTEIFGNMMLLPGVYQNAIDAVQGAYATVYDSYHGWAVQKIFNYSLQAAPEVDIIYRHMHYEKLKELTAAALNGESRANSADGSAMVRGLSVENEDMGASFETYPDGDISLLVYDEDVNQTPYYEFVGYNETYLDAGAKEWSITDADDDGSPWFVRLGFHLTSEWDKLATNIGKEIDKFGMYASSEWDKFSGHVQSEWGKFTSGMFQGVDYSMSEGDGSKRRAALYGDALESYISEKIEEDVKEHIVKYLEVVSPILEDIAGLYAEMNMDDPTKV